MTDDGWKEGQSDYFIIGRLHFTPGSNKNCVDARLE